MVERKPYPFKWVDASEEETKERAKLFKNEIGVENPMVKSVPGNVYMPKKFTLVAKALYNMEVRPDDIWIVTYPKCGTTLTQELVWQVVNNVNLDPDRPNFFERSPFVEFSALLQGPLIARDEPIPEEMLKELLQERTDPRLQANSLAWTEDMKSPRVIKSHLPLEFLPPNLLEKAKVIYVCRNPRDVCVSYFHHTNTMHTRYGFKGTFEQYMDLFMKGELGCGSYWDHLKSGWHRRNHPNMMFLWFEDMKKDLIKVIKDVSKFTGYHLTDYKVLVLDDALYIDNFRKMHVEESTTKERKEMMSKFIRKGKVGDHKNLISGELAKRFNKWVEEHSRETDYPKFL